MQSSFTYLSSHNEVTVSPLNLAGKFDGFMHTVFTSVRAIVKR